MPKEDALNIINKMGTAARVNRLKAADYFSKHPEKFNELLQLVFNTSYKYNHKAAWVLEFVLKDHLDWIIPHIDLFSKSISKLRNDSAIRPIAKICQWIAVTYVKKHDKTFQSALTNKHITAIIETSFDWMIGDYRVATKSYTMDTLYFFGCLSNKEFSWIHSELEHIIIQDMNTGSSGYKSHGKKILNLLN